MRTEVKLEKMKATELRIGNWIHYSSKVGMDEGDIQCETFHMDEMRNNSKYSYSPILLTEDILLKKGFEKKYSNVFGTGKSTSYKYGRFELYLNEELDYGKYRHGSGVYISYLHELQNLYFVLTGYELKIEL